MKIAGREYTTGVDRNDDHLVAHLYAGGFADGGDPMCARGWNRCDGAGYSIFRNLPDAVICKICLRRARQLRQPIKAAQRKTKWI